MASSTSPAALRSAGRNALVPGAVATSAPADKTTRPRARAIAMHAPGTTASVADRFSRAPATLTGTVVSKANAIAGSMPKVKEVVRVAVTSNLAFSPNRDLAVYGTGWMTGVRDFAIGLGIYRLGGGEASLRRFAITDRVAGEVVIGASVSDDGKRITTVSTGDHEGVTRTWDAATGAQIEAPQKVQLESLGGIFRSLEQTTVSHDGKLIAVGKKVGDIGGAVLIYDTHTGAPLAGVSEHHNSIVDALAFSPDDRTVLSGGRDGRVVVWSAASGLPAGAPISLPPGPDRSRTPWASAVAQSRDNKTIAAAAYSDPAGINGMVSFWDGATHAMVGKPVTFARVVQALAFSPDGNYVFVCESEKIHALDMRSGTLVGEAADLSQFRDIWNARGPITPSSMTFDDKSGALVVGTPSGGIATFDFGFLLKQTR